MIANNQSKPEKSKFLCIELLKNFSTKEMNRLTSFVESHYFNQDDVVTKLLAALNQWVLPQQHFDSALLCLVFKKVFEEKLVNEKLTDQQKKQFNYKMSALLRLAERFLVIEDLENQPAYYSDILYQKILEKRQFNFFNRHINKTKKQLKTNLEKGVKHYEHQQKIEKNVLDYLYLTNQLTKQDNLSELIYHIDTTYIINKLSLQNTLLYLEKITSKKHDTSSMDAMKPLLNLSQYTAHPLINIYQVAISLTKTQSKSAYKKLLILIDKHHTEISKDDLNGFYLVAANFCSIQIQAGQMGYQNLFEVYKLMDEKYLLLENNIIPADKLKTVVAAGCRTGEFDWAVKMIEKYQLFVEKRVRESVYHFNLGVVAFYQLNYEKALHHFIRVESINFNYDINCRVIMMKAHYECDQEYDERTVQIFRSAEKYFNENQQLTSKNKKAYKNFIRTLINVYRIRFGATKMKLENVLEKLKQQKVNSDREWLMQKLKSL